MPGTPLSLPEHEEIAANPTRFPGRRPEPPKLPTVAWINDPNEEVTQKAS